MTIGEGISGAYFSDERRYRFALWRIWSRAEKPVLFIGLNPSTAGAVNDDNTIVRCADFAKSWGYGGMFMGNLYPFVSTNPNYLRRDGTEARKSLIRNDSVLIEMAALSGMVVACWGRWDASAKRAPDVLPLFDKVHCLTRTKSGQPGHPLYLSSACKPILYAEKGVVLGKSHADN